MADPNDHPRLVLHDFLSSDQCKELEFIHKSCCCVGYRHNVFSTTLSHLIATNSPHLILPFVSIRECLKDKVEDYFGCQFELCVEFTGLISWTRGSNIGWHSDDNRPYLKQRDFALQRITTSRAWAVNKRIKFISIGYGVDFKGGLFHFQEGEPTTIVPMAGDVVLYTADSRNIHSVDEIMDGERLTLTLWFSRNSTFDEDDKLLSFLSQSLLHDVNSRLDSCLPVPASSNMYWFPPYQASQCNLGFDIRYARIHILGFDLFSSEEKGYTLASDSSSDITELLGEPLQLAKSDELFGKEFTNVLHALQVLQFYCWKASDSVVQTWKVERKISNVITLSPWQREKIRNLRDVFLKDTELADTFFSPVWASKKDRQHPLDWAGLSAAVTAWEAYTRKLHEELHFSLMHWKTQHSIFSIQPNDIGES